MLLQIYTIYPNLNQVEEATNQINKHIACSTNNKSKMFQHNNKEHLTEAILTP